MIGLATGLGIAVFLWKSGLYREIPSIVGTGVEIVTETIAATAKAVKTITPKDIPTIQPRMEWLNNVPPLTPGEMLFAGGLMGAAYIGLKCIRVLRSFIK